MVLRAYVMHLGGGLYGIALQNKMKRLDQIERLMTMSILYGIYDHDTWQNQM